MPEAPKLLRRRGCDLKISRSKCMPEGRYPPNLFDAERSSRMVAVETISEYSNRFYGITGASCVLMLAE